MCVCVEVKVLVQITLSQNFSKVQLLCLCCLVYDELGYIFVSDTCAWYFTSIHRHGVICLKRPILPKMKPFMKILVKFFQKRSRELKFQSKEPNSSKHEALD